MNTFGFVQVKLHAFESSQLFDGERVNFAFAVVLSVAVRFDWESPEPAWALGVEGNIRRVRESNCLSSVMVSLFLLICVSRIYQLRIISL